MAWTTPTDVQNRWVGNDVPTDTNLVVALIDDAEAIILSQYPKIQDRIDANTLSLNTVIMVVCRMVSRLLRNPEGLTYWQMNTGPFGQGKNYGAGGRGTDVWMSPEEVKLLAPKTKGKAFEVDTAPYATNGGNWIWLSGNGYNNGDAVTGGEWEEF
jgi:hypothetical protein